VGILGLAQPLALSTPLTNAQLPFPLFVNGNEVSANVEVTSYALTDGGFGSPQLFDFTIRDPGGTIDPWIAKQQRVLWVDSVNGRYLFAGYIKNIHTRPQAIWQDIDVTCGDLSEALDSGRPIVSYEAGARSTSDQGEIQAMLGIYAQDGQLASGGFIQEMAPAMPGSTPVSRTTLRNGIDQILAASGVQGAVSYVDALGYLHTLAIGDVAGAVRDHRCGPRALDRHRAGRHHRPEPPGRTRCQRLDGHHRDLWRQRAGRYALAVGRQGPDLDEHRSSGRQRPD